ncbi:transcription factor bHLH111 [Solanum dulcamara]|uniref:transcription factor bHLH111 n=1 Tax=Solanum dulcamara TaxID=45834 RepID=UPI002486BB41|nr:transcription factor bHLH111 [Solanum dulcamara]
MSEKSILEYTNLANNNNNPNCYLMSQNWWPQVDNNNNSNIFHPISTNSSLSSCNTNRSSSCEEDVISISNNNNGNSATNNNLHRYQFLLGVDHENNSSLISGEIAANSDDHHNHLIWSQLLLSNSTTSGTSGSINTKNLLENNMEMSLLDGGSTTTTLITSKSCFDHNQMVNNHDDDDDYSFHPYSNLLGRPFNYYTNNNTNNNNNDDDMDSMFPLRSDDQIAHQDQVDKSRNLASICFGGYLSNKPLVDFKPSLKTLNLAQHKKNGLQQPSLSKSRGTISTCNTLKRSNGRAQEYYPSDGKKRKLEDNSETNSKRQKNESSAVSSAKIQVPKVKLADKITALQQIVSPFGKTDTASVLWETINYVRFLQEQIQLLSHAYMKSNTCKERYWGGFEGKEVDLRSKGLCLVPISCTPQIYHDTNNGSDYLIPSYRGCLYR